MLPDFVIKYLKLEMSSREELITEFMYKIKLYSYHNVFNSYNCVNIALTKNKK